MTNNEAKKKKEEAIEQLELKYLLRYPFTFTAFKWGAGIGSILSLHSFIRYKNPLKALLMGINSSLIIGFPIYGFFLIKHIIYSHSTKSYDSNQKGLLDIEDSVREFYIDKLELENNIDNDKLFKVMEEKKLDLEKKYLILNYMIEKKDFDV